MNATISKRIRCGTLLALVATSLACAPALAPPSAAQLLLAQQRWPSATMADFERGRATYLERCSSCHTPHSPEQFPQARWPQLVHEMRENARLSPQEEEDILRYPIAGSGALVHTEAMSRPRR